MIEKNISGRNYDAFGAYYRNIGLDSGQKNVFFMLFNVTWKNIEYYMGLASSEWRDIPRIRVSHYCKQKNKIKLNLKKKFRCNMSFGRYVDRFLYNIHHGFIYINYDCRWRSLQTVLTIIFLIINMAGVAGCSFLLTNLFLINNLVVVPGIHSFFSKRIFVVVTYSIHL